MNDKPVRADAVSATEALSVYERGGELLCPVCAKYLVTIPAELQAGTRPMGLVCPESNRHYLIYGEGAETLGEARQRMRRIAAKSDPGGE